MALKNHLTTPMTSGTADRSDLGGSSRLALLTVASAIVLSGCAGVVPTSTEPGSQAALGAAPVSFESIGPDAPGLSVETGDRTLYRFSTDGLDYEDQMVTFAFRAKEPIKYGVLQESSVRVEEWPADGWMRYSAVVSKMPVDVIWGNTSPSMYTFTKRGAAGTPHVSSTWVSQGSLHVHATVDGETVVSVAEGYPEAFPPTTGGTTGSLSPTSELERGDWVFVYIGGTSPGRNEETELVHTFNVTGEIEIYRLPDRALRYGFGFDTADQAGVLAGAGQIEATVDAKVTHETDRTSLLYIDSYGAGSGEGEIVFPGETRPIPQQNDNRTNVRLSAPSGAEIGFDIERWTGQPRWFLTDAWLPPSPF